MHALVSLCIAYIACVYKYSLLNRYIKLKAKTENKLALLYSIGFFQRFNVVSW